MKYPIFALFLFLSFTLLTFAQKPTPTPPDDENDVVKISTSLVQLDAIVTDKKGNPITDLSVEDFEILQDGKTQKITNFSYINRIGNAEKTTRSQTLASKNNDKNLPLTAPSSVRSNEFGRVLTFVVDDGNNCATQLGMIAAKEGLKKFVNEQMLPNDSVAIYQTRNGSSLLQQYTSDKSRLLGIIQKIRWYPPRGIFVSCGNETIQNNINEKPQNNDQREAIENSIKDGQIEGLIGVTRYAINGLRQIGGRKVMFIMSDSLPLMVGKGINVEISRSFSAIKDLAELANRTAVVLNTIDVRGLTNPSLLEAADDAEGLARTGGEKGAENFIGNRNLSDSQRRSGLASLAIETGGKFYENTNFLDLSIQKALSIEKGYYLLGYEPENETFKGKSFHKISVKLKREDLNVSSRSGFSGKTDEELRPKPRTGDSELYRALTAPIPNADLNIKLSSYFANTPSKGNFIRALLYIDGKDITFLDEPGKTKKIVFDMVAVTLNEKNEVIDDTNRTATVHIPVDRVEEVRRDGLVYSVDVPVKKDGVYTFRTALRDTTAKRLGSSSQVIEVPNLSKSKLLISGLLISGVDGNGQILPTESGESAFSSVVSPAIAAIRKFKRNSVAAYSYTLYNAKPDSATNLPNLTIQTNLYYDGQIFSEGRPQSADLGKQTDLSRINDFGYLKLNANIPTGDYVLQVIVKDLTTNQITSQWIDFEVVE
jgi:VWFA-related protein